MQIKPQFDSLERVRVPRGRELTGPDALGIEEYEQGRPVLQGDVG